MNNKEKLTEATISLLKESIPPDNCLYVLLTLIQILPK